MFGLYAPSLVQRFLVEFPATFVLLMFSCYEEKWQLHFGMSRGLETRHLCKAYVCVI